MESPEKKKKDILKKLYQTKPGHYFKAEDLNPFMPLTVFLEVLKEMEEELAALKKKVHDMDASLILLRRKILERS